MTTTAKATPAKSDKPNAITMLVDDHKLVKKLFKEFDKIKDSEDDDEKEALVARICEELTVHADAEEQIFYPAARAAIGDEDLMDEAEVEHAGAKELIAQLQSMQPSDDLYNAKVTVLSEYIDHHVSEEESDMFPKSKKAKLDLEALGEQLQAFKDGYNYVPPSVSTPAKRTRKSSTSTRAHN